jgi:hypothetical protein
MLNDENTGALIYAYPTEITPESKGSIAVYDPDEMQRGEHGKHHFKIMDGSALIAVLEIKFK